MWFLEKKELTDQIKELEGKLAASEATAADLRSKNNILEYCLRQLKTKGTQVDPEINDQEIPMPQRRPKSNKPQINK